AMVAAGSDSVFEGPTGSSEQEAGSGDCSNSMIEHKTHGQPIAAAYAGAGDLVVQTREPAQIVFVSSGTVIALPRERQFDTGHEFFHRSPNRGARVSVACASCHAEGRDDGRTWNFNPTGLRRTQSIGGGVLDTEPLHWDGDLPDVDAM